MKVGVIGTGTWGTALAKVLCDNGHSVLMYGRDNSQVESINKTHTNPRYFSPEIKFSKKIKATNSLEEFANKTSIVIISIPSIAVRNTLLELNKYLTRKTLFINTAKGFDPATNKRMSEVIRESIPEEKRYEVVSLLGPSHAEEVILSHVTMICAVSKSLSKARKVQKLFSNEYFRVYSLKDEVGAELGAAIKNSIAIVSGISDGMGFGDNAKAAIVTRGLVEIIRFGRYFGAKKETFLGLTGVGDLMVTCNSVHSRNYRAGKRIGLDGTSKYLLENLTETVEGIRTTEVVYKIAKENHISMPIVEAVYKIIYENKPLQEAVVGLMTRPLKEED